jgi:YesN/AraC family two-component response regulator
MDKKLRILIVDDNPRARHGLSALLSMQQGSAVICEASNGEEALMKIESQNPDFVLMDIQMPVMDGLTATQIIKQRWPQVKVILLTLYTDYRCQAKQAGADAFLVKGCSFEEITSAICPTQ